MIKLTNKTAVCQGNPQEEAGGRRQETEGRRQETEGRRQEVEADRSKGGSNQLFPNRQGGYSPSHEHRSLVASNSLLPFFP